MNQLLDDTEVPGVSALIAHFGPVEMTATLVEDLLAQHYERVEVIVSDDASPIVFPDGLGATVIRSQQNRGYGSAINRAARIATQPWLLILNSDIRLAPDFLHEALTRAVSRAPAIFGFSHRSATRRVPSAAPLPLLTSTLGQQTNAVQPLARMTGWHRAWQWSDPNDESIRKVGWVSGAAMLIPTALFRDVGGFDERFFMFSEEVDLQRRLYANGVPAVLLGDVEIEHLGGASSTTLERQAEQLRSRLLYEEVARGRASRWALEAGLWAGIGIDTLYARVRGRGHRGGTKEQLESIRMRLRALRSARGSTGP